MRLAVPSQQSTMFFGILVAYTLRTDALLGAVLMERLPARRRITLL